MHDEKWPIAVLNKMLGAAPKDCLSQSTVAVGAHHDQAGIILRNRLLKPDFDWSIITRQPMGLSVDPIPFESFRKIA